MLVWTYASWMDWIGRILASVAAVGAGTAYPLMTIVFGNFVNDFNQWAIGQSSPASFQASVNSNATYLVYLWVGKFTLSYISSIFYHATGSRIAKRLRLAYLSGVLNQPISFFDLNSSAAMTNSLTSDVNVIETGIGEKVAVMLQGIGMLLAALIISITYSWKLALVCFTTTVWTIVATGGLTTVVMKLQAKIKDVYIACASVSEEALGTTQTINALGASEKMVNKFQGFVNRALQTQKYHDPLWASVYGNMFFSQHACYALCLFYGVKLVNRGEIDGGGTVFTVMFCVIQGSSALGLIAPSLPDILKSCTAAQRVISFLRRKQPRDTEDKSLKALAQGGLRDPHSRQNIRFENVSFEYPGRPDVKVIKNLSFEIPCNQLTAVVGPSGSGKSTIIALLDRWYDPTEGAIFVEDVDIRTIPKNAWRSKIAFVQQAPVLFNDTIVQNVLNGYNGDTEKMTESEILQLVSNACSKADIHDFIKNLPDGYQTRVGERAMQLSGGQIQRLAIARAIISEPEILILDEHTSNLDTKSHHLVQNALYAATTGRTTIEIAHNLSTARRAAKIVVMSDGCVVEEGNHKELLELNGLYAQLVQTLEADDEDTSATRTDENDTETPPKQVQEELSLDSVKISRRHGLAWCLINFAKFYPYMIPWSISGASIGLIASSTFPISAYLFAKLVTVFQLQGTSDFVPKGNFWALMFFVMAAVEIFAYFAVFYFFGMARTEAAKKYHPQYFKSMLEQDATFFETPGHSAGVLTTLLFDDSEMVGTFMGSNLPLMSIFLIEVIACAILSIALYWKLGLVAVFGGLPLVLCTGLVRVKMEQQAQNRTESIFLESTRFGAEALSAIRTVVSLCLENEVVKRYETRLNEATNRSNSRSIVYFFFFALCDSIDLLVMALLFWYGGILLSRNELSVENYYVIYIAAIFGGQAAGFAFGYSMNIAKAQAGANRMLYLKSTHPAINSTKGGDPTTTPTLPDVPAVEFRNVKFHYPSRPNVEILRGLSFTINRGENVCLVGPSGCGKSTVISLLERQETVLYQGNIKENLLLGVKGEVTRERLEEVCKQANIHEFIMSLPEGYETNCGSKGLMLSGGQRQRISIARAILREPKILLLDEATSSLDPTNAKMVAAALENAMKGRTTISSTHNIEIMRKADRVLVIKEGRIAEDGRWEHRNDF
ncbi:hypothetical protein ABW20_dc0105575 [Dactylellina cionopaga]|nr:hypothetical protein ABW20_dc0105575 [Dactylellina cionopaga]